MPYLTVENFNFGLDRRRKRVAGTPGTLWDAQNVHITRGGDIERRKKLIPEYNVAGSFGGAAIRSQLYTFGSADLAASMPVDVQYQRLVAPASPAMVALLDVKTFLGKFYAIAEYADGSVRHFYNGTRVTDWDVIGAANASFETVAKVLADKIESNEAVTAASFGNKITIRSRTPGTAFSISKSTTNGGAANDQDITLATVQANVAAVEEVVATATIEVVGGTADAGVNYISSVLLNSVELLTSSLNWSGSNATTAIALAAAINAGFATHGYSAAAIDGVVTISAAPGTGATPNGYELFVFPHGDVQVNADATLTGGVTAVTAVAQVVTATFSGTVEAADTFEILIGATSYKTTMLASGTGRTLFISDSRVWSPVGSLWRYCMLSRADIWDPANATPDNDAGFINVASEAEGNENLEVAARYQDFAAVFSASNILLWQLDEDPANFSFQNVLENTGTVAPKSVIRYGNNDVFYLDITGVRSLRARDASNAPFVSDVGNAIDTFLNEFLDTLTRDQVTGAGSAIEPRDGRYMLVAGSRAFVLSYFPGAKITAWTYYDFEELDGAAVQSVFRRGKQLFVRAGDFLYCYGGLDGDEYPDNEEIIARVKLPFLSGKTPATIKSLTGFDMAGTNTWEVVVAFDPNDEEKTIAIGRLDDVTLADPESVPSLGETSMVAPELVCDRAGPATLSMLAIHYQGGEAA